MSQITTALILDTRRELSGGLYPVKLRVTYRRKSRVYGFTVGGEKITLSEKDFQSVMAMRPKGSHKEIRTSLDAVELRARSIITGLDPFTWDDFSEQFRRKPADQNDATYWFREKIRLCYKENKPGTAEYYEFSMNSLLTVMDRKQLPFEVITRSFLERYEKRMIAAGKSPNTIAAYLRALRFIFNEAIAKDVLSESLYPFGKRKYQLPVGDAPAKALSPDDVRMFIEYEPEPMSLQHFAKDMFFLSYFWKGINPADFFQIRYEDIEEGRIIFYRKKTKGTTRTRSKPITVYLEGMPKEIIERWGQGGSGFVFNVVHSRMSSESKRRAIKNTTRSINRQLKNIFKELGIDEPVSMNYARHSFATMLHHAGFDEERIARMLGHTTTEVVKRHYIDDNLSESQEREVREILTPRRKEEDGIPGAASDN